MKPLAPAARPRARRALLDSILAILAITAFVAAHPAIAAWQPSGVQVGGLCEPEWWNFRDAGAAPDGAGGVYASWYAAWNQFGIRHLTAAGDDAPGWPSCGLRPTTFFGNSSEFRLAPDGVGGVYVGWLASTCFAHCISLPGSVYVQHLTYAGARADGWPPEGLRVVTRPLAWEPPVVVPDELGGVLIAWLRRYRYDTRPQLIRVQRFDANGSQPWLGGANFVEVAPASPGSQIDPALVGDGMGGALIAWTDSRPSASAPQIYIQHVDASGALRDSAGLALTASPYRQRLPRMIADAAGGAYLAWQDSTAGSGLDLRVQRLDGLGNPQWGAGVLVAGGTPVFQSQADLCLDGADGVFVAWIEGGTNGVLKATRLDGAGSVVPPWQITGNEVGGGAGGRTSPRLAADGAGGFYLTWVSGVMYATHANADGSRAAGWPLGGMPLCTNGPGLCGPVETWTTSQATWLYPRYLIADGIGGAVAVWNEYRWIDSLDPPSTFDRIIAQRLGVDGPVPVLASLVSADASDGIVRIEWQVSGGGELDVERAIGSPESGWSFLARVAPDGLERVRVDDPAVRPGERYGYRLVRREGADPGTLGETWLTVPRAEGLRIASARPNPATGELRLAFALPDASPAVLEVLDVAGRRVVLRRLEGLGAGEHDLRLDESAALPAGAYLIRLSQGGRYVTTRACLLH
ncbi:MAG: hypothetical protein A2W00_14650 [Candidatus Eisenbacteria bacterium RBG_16_71_46]|nr:MAG: hypothetical protein A2W00_14650 [Candidatus Eisenbacteria bacterium RBG_16_71_46]